MEDLASLPKGFQFPQTCLRPSADEVMAYRKAVGDVALGHLEEALAVEHAPWREDDPNSPLVPPLALVAWALRYLMQNYPLPPGVIHSSQEVAFYRPVHANQEVHCDARIVNRSQRAGGLFISIDMEGRTAQGEQAFTARAMIGAGLAAPAADSSETEAANA